LVRIKIPIKSIQAMQTVNTRLVNGWHEFINEHKIINNNYRNYNNNIGGNLRTKPGDMVMIKKAFLDEVKTMRTRSMGDKTSVAIDQVIVLDKHINYIRITGLKHISNMEHILARDGNANNNSEFREEYTALRYCRMKMSTRKIPCGNAKTAAPSIPSKIEFAGMDLATIRVPSQFANELEHGKWYLFGDGTRTTGCTVAKTVLAIRHGSSSTDRDELTMTCHVPGATSNMRSMLVQFVDTSYIDN
jgi:hypothetical protein